MRFSTAVEHSVASYCYLDLQCSSAFTMARSTGFTPDQHLSTGSIDVHTHYDTASYVVLFGMNLMDVRHLHTS